MVAGNLSLSEKYRPRQWHDFIGKADAVRYLTTQVSRNGGRSVLLHGPAGSGKSSLGEVYAAALLCTANGDRPCWLEECQSCSALRYGNHLNLKRFQFGRVSDEEFADQINADVRTETFGNGRFVVLIDQAELLSDRALDILHRQMKRPYEGVTFILCVADANGIRRETSTLFYPLAVAPPGFLEATAYIERVCGREHVALDAKSVEVLADLGRCSFQELALALETLAGSGQTSAAAILDHYMGGGAASYVDLVVNRRPFADQLTALERWPRSPGEMIRQTGEYLSRLFDIRHGLQSDSLHKLAREAELSDAITRHAEAIRLRPRIFAARMLQIRDPEPLAGPTTLRRKASEFDALFGSAAFDLSDTNAVTAGWRDADRRMADYKAVEKRERKASPSSGVETTGDAESLTLDEATKLWHGASFMVQAYGTLLNVTIAIQHGKFVPASAKKPEQVITDFLRELRIFVTRVKADPAAELHALYVHRTERTDDLVTTIYAHLPICKRNVVGWIKGFFFRRASGASVEQAVSVELFETGDAFERHLSLIRSACSGLMPVLPEHQMLLRRMRIERKQCRSLGPRITSQRVGLSRLIDKRAQRTASDDLEVLYVLDDSEADACSRWELKEYEYRRQLLEQRARLETSAQGRPDGEIALATVRQQWGSLRTLREARRPGFS